MNDITPIQTDVFSKLTAAPPTYAVYDGVPQGIAKPYIAIGEFVGENGEELSLTTTSGSFQFHTWSATTSKGQSYAMLQFIRSRLAGVAVSGTWAFVETFNEVMEDPASTATSRIYHGVARYEFEVG